LTGHSSDAVSSAKKVQVMAEKLDDLSLKIVANYYLGTAYFTAGDYRRTGECLEQAILPLAGDLGRDRFGLAGFPVVMARVFWAWALAESGDFNDAMTQGQEAVRLAETLNHPYSQAFAFRALGHVYSLKGDFRQAIPLLKHGVTLCREWNLHFVTPTLAELLGYVYALAGRLSEGIDLLRDAVADAESIGFSMFLTPAIVHFSEVLLLSGQIEEAAVSAEQALKLARKHGQRSQEAWAQRLLGESSAQSNPRDIEAAEGGYREALTLARGLDMRPLIAHCHVGLGRLVRRAGKPEHALENFSIAARMWREMDMRFWLEKAEAEMRGVA
jgi:tetratricopeptide (TPR) repeat protein